MRDNEPRESRVETTLPVDKEIRLYDLAVENPLAPVRSVLHTFEINRSLKESNGRNSHTRISQDRTAEERLLRRKKCGFLCNKKCIILFFLMVCMIAIQSSLFIEYNGFRTVGWHRIFLFWAICYILLFLLYGIKILKLICTNGKKGKVHRRRSTMGWVPSCVMEIYKAKRHFNLRGKYFLMKLQISEVFEHFQRIFSYTVVYSCKMSPTMSIIQLALILVEVTYSSIEIFRLETKTMRDRRIFFDLFMDIFYNYFPIGWCWYYLHIPIDVSEMVQMTFLVSLWTLMKIRTLIKDIIFVGKKKIYFYRGEANPSLSKYRSQSSFVTPISVQLTHFSKKRRLVFLLINGTFIIFCVGLLFLRIVNVFSNNDTCHQFYTEKVWQGCQVEVPFCQDPFKPHCDCAILKVYNFSRSQLDENSFLHMNSLLKLNIVGGDLERLPQKLGTNFINLVELEVSGNRLSSIPDDVGEWKKLMKLSVRNNRLVALPLALGKLTSLTWLDCGHNQIAALQREHLAGLDRLSTLRANNNLIASLPVEVGDLLQLQSVWIHNNKLKSLPDSFGNLKDLVEFLAWNNTLEFLAESLGGLSDINVIDVRHNKIKAFPSKLLSKRTKVKFPYFAGNPLCQNYKLPDDKLYLAGTMCEEQCSIDCENRWQGDGKCDDNEYSYYIHSDTNDRLSSTNLEAMYVSPKVDMGCNLPVCNNDRGDCSPSE